jgi:hypothetical protein
LVVRHRHDAADVVLLGAVLLLRKVAHQVAALGVVLERVRCYVTIFYSNTCFNGVSIHVRSP